MTRRLRSFVAAGLSDGRIRGFFFGATACLALLSGSRRAEATPREECFAAAEESQPLQASGSLLKARERLQSCTNAACPRAVRNDCVRWLAEVQAAIPSLVVLAKDDDGHDVADVRVTIDDGAVVIPRLDGQPVLLDPGEHVLHYEPTRGVAGEVRIVLGAGQKNRVVSLSIAQPKAAPPPPPPPPSPPPLVLAPPVERSTAPPATARPIPVSAYVLGGVALAGLASLTVFGVEAANEYSQLRSSGCSPNCSPSQVDEGKRDADIADVSLGIAALAVIATTVVILTRPSRTASVGTVRRSPDLGARLLRGGGALGFGASF
jgi:hypothetical protein